MIQHHWEVCMWLLFLVMFLEEHEIIIKKKIFSKNDWVTVYAGKINLEKKKLLIRKYFLIFQKLATAFLWYWSFIWGGGGSQYNCNRPIKMCSFDHIFLWVYYNYTFGSSLEMPKMEVSYIFRFIFWKQLCGTKKKKKKKNFFFFFWGYFENNITFKRSHFFKAFFQTGFLMPLTLKQVLVRCEFK